MRPIRDIRRNEERVLRPTPGFGIVEVEANGIEFRPECVRNGVTRQSQRLGHALRPRHAHDGGRDARFAQ